MIKSPYAMQEDIVDGQVGNFDPIPEGEELISEIEEFEAKTFNSGSHGVKIKWKVVDDAYKNRTCYDYIVLTSVNPDAEKKTMTEKRGAAKINSICTAAGLSEWPSDAREYVGLRAKLRFGQDEPNEQGKIYNRVKKVFTDRIESSQKYKVEEVGEDELDF